MTGLFFVRAAFAQAEPPPAEAEQPPPPPVEAPPTDSAVAPPASSAETGEVGPEFDASEEKPAAAKALVGLDMTFFTMSPQTTEVTILAPMIRAVVPLGMFAFEGELPFVYYSTKVSFPPVPGVTLPSVEDSGFLVANPTFAVKYHYRKDDLDVYVGGGISLPLARLDSGDTSNASKAVGYGGAAATRGGWNIWWYVPNALTLFVPAGVRYAQKQGADIGAEVGAGMLINTGGGNSDVLGAIQVGGHLGYAAPFLETGLQVKGVRFPGDGNGDRFQVSLEPYVRALFESAYVGAGFLINADDPYGPWLDTGSVWGLRVEGGARF